jgi:hypothetical protein
VFLATVGEANGLSLAGPARISESGNRFFKVAGDFLIDFDEIPLVRCFGREAEIVIGNDIESIAAGCFHDRASPVSMRFASDCGISILGEAAFSGTSP